jgi:hypothetical protein
LIQYSAGLVPQSRIYSDSIAARIRYGADRSFERASIPAQWCVYNQAALCPPRWYVYIRSVCRSVGVLSDKVGRAPCAYYTAPNQGVCDMCTAGWYQSTAADTTHLNVTVTFLSSKLTFLSSKLSSKLRFLSSKQTFSQCGPAPPTPARYALFAYVRAQRVSHRSCRVHFRRMVLPPYIR